MQLGDANTRARATHHSCTTTACRHSSPFDASRQSAFTDADYLVTELQYCRVALAAQHARSEVSAPPAPPTLEADLFSLCKLLAIPATEDALKAHPDRALAQIKAKVSAVDCKFGPCMTVVAFFPAVDNAVTSSVLCWLLLLQVSKLMEKLPGGAIDTVVPLLDGKLASSAALVRSHTEVALMLMLPRPESAWPSVFCMKRPAVLGAQLPTHIQRCL